MNQETITDTVESFQTNRTFRPRRQFKAGLMTLGFIVLLFLPTLDQWLSLSKDDKSVEKRTLAALPTFHFPHVQTFIVQFNQYYKDNFGWRNVLFHRYSQLKFSLMGSSPLPDKVLVGLRHKHRWLYPGNSLNLVADQHRGLQPIHTDTLAAISRNLVRLQQQFSKQGAKTYILIAPDSYTIYPEHLPDYFQSASFVSNFDRLKSFMAQQTTIPVIDVRKALMSAKGSRDTYHHTDTHWNEFGSLIAALACVNRVRQDFPAIPEPRLSDFQITPKEGVGGDLVVMLALQHEVKDAVDYTIKPGSFLQSKNTLTKDIENGLPYQRFVTDHRNRPKLLLIGDSFSFSLNQSLPGYFRESYLVRSNTCDMELVRDEHPDIVILEIAERNLNRLRQL